jgi:hypothetical protein
MAASHGELPALGYVSGRAQYPVPSIPFVEFRPLSGMALLSAVKDDGGVADDACTVGGELAQGENAVDAGATRRPRIDEIAAAVVVPQWAGVYHALATDDAQRLAPALTRVVRLHHEDAVVGIAPIDIVLSVVITEGWGPYALAMLRLGEETVGSERLQGMADNLPVHQVSAVQDGESGDAVERTCCEIIVVTDSNGIGVAVVGVENGVDIVSVALVGVPHLRMVLRMEGERDRREQEHGYRQENVIHSEEDIIAFYLLHVFIKASIKITKVHRKIRKPIMNLIYKK